jgi:4-hydroxy-tetrahydrodipicolinate reductase
MPTDPIRVVQFGLGPIGLAVTRHIVEKPHLRLVGAVDVDSAKIGRKLAELAETDEAGDVRVVGPADFSESADVAVVTTTSSLEAIAPHLLDLIARGLSVVSTCEELSYPWRTRPDLAERIDAAAKAEGAAVLGCGVNPGFIMDFLPLAMTGLCRRVEGVRVWRLQDAAKRRLPFQKKIGAGLTPEEFAARVEAKTLRHIGLTESIHMIADRLGWPLDRTEDVVEPAIARKPARTAEMEIPAGRALGVLQTGRGWREGREVITLTFRATIGEAETPDRIVIEGAPPIDLTIAGGAHGDVATCAVTVNAISAIVRAAPGLRTMADLAPLSCYAPIGAPAGARD